MLDYHAPQLDEQEQAKKILRKTGYMGSDGAFGTIYVWREIYHSQICFYQGFFMRKYGENYTFPLGEGDLIDAIEAMQKDASERGVPFVMAGLTENDVQKMEELFPGRYCYEEDRDSAEYIYTAENLAQLKGKKYHGKRNHISKFQRLYQWTYEDLGQENMDDCIRLAKEWCVQYGCNKENGLDKEACALRESFDHFEELGFCGGMIRVDDKPVAFTIGEEINPDIFVVHFEKALSDYTGAYTMINREFASKRLAEYQYINREEDMGLEGLRKAKLSYYPAILLQRYTARRKG